MTAAALQSLLSPLRFRHANETELQAGIASVLEGAGVAFEREVPLSANDRPDFLIGDVAVEVKTGGGLADALRQLDRYAKHARVQELILVTTRMTHRAVPDELRGKPLHVIYLRGSL